MASGWCPDGRKCAGTAPQVGGYREDYDESRLHRPGPYRSDGTGGVLLEPDGFHPPAIRNQLERHAEVVKQSTARKSLELGLRHYTRDDLETVRAAGETLHIHVLGLASIAMDVTPELARAAIASVSVLGALHASAAVKAALADRMV